MEVVPTIFGKSARCPSVTAIWAPTYMVRSRPSISRSTRRPFGRAVQVPLVLIIRAVTLITREITVRRSRTSKSSSLRARTARLPTCATSLRARRMAMDRISRGAISTSRSTAFPIPAPPSTGARSISRTVSPTFPSNRAAPLISVSSLRATPIT